MNRNGTGLAAQARRRRVGWRVVGGLGWLALALGACIIEERKYSQQLDDCWDYCDRLDTNCNGNNKVYEHREACMATCMLMDRGGEIGDSTADTLTCRLDRLRAGLESPQCPLVGPGGGGACGSNCKALCALRQKVCKDVPSVSDPSDVNDLEKCESDCEALADRQDMDASGVDLSGDTVQCRLVYISQAAISPEQAIAHCEHSQIRPAPGENSETAPCSDPAGVPLEVECDKYCSLVTRACTGSNRVYASKEQCVDTCRKTMVPGEPGDQTGDTIRCRRYHSYFSLIAPDQHCMHASATGDGHCGDENCTAYCRVLRTGCGERFATEFGATAGTVDGGLSECISQCMGLDGAGRDEFAVRPLTSARYQIDPPPTGNTVLCRAYHAVQALTDPSHCGEAFGEGSCQ